MAIPDLNYTKLKNSVEATLELPVMTIERWTDAQLDRLASTAAANAAATSNNRAAIADLRGAVASLLEIVTLHQQDFEASQRNFEAIQAEIRGLQTENRRILDHLFGQNNDPP